jgi:hypothetical protein
MPTMEWAVVGLNKPKGWPSAWAFPRGEAWPPAWPCDLTGLDRVKIEAIFNLGVMRFRAIDQYGDGTHVLDGMYLQIIAGSSDVGALRLRSNGQDCWCEGMLIEIADYGKADALIDVEIERSNGHRFLELSLYGVNNTPVISLGA